MREFDRGRPMPADMARRQRFAAGPANQYIQRVNFVPLAIVSAVPTPLMDGRVPALTFMVQAHPNNTADIFFGDRSVTPSSGDAINPGGVAVLEVTETDLLQWALNKRRGRNYQNVSPREEMEMRGAELAMPHAFDPEAAHLYLNIADYALIATAGAEAQRAVLSWTQYVRVPL